MHLVSVFILKAINLILIKKLCSKKQSYLKLQKMLTFVSQVSFRLLKVSGFKYFKFNLKIVFYFFIKYGNSEPTRRKTECLKCIKSNENAGSFCDLKMVRKEISAINQKINNYL